MELIPCPKCGSMNGKDVKECLICGQPMTEETPPDFNEFLNEQTGLKTVLETANRGSKLLEWLASVALLSGIVAFVANYDKGAWDNWIVKLGVVLMAIGFLSLAVREIAVRFAPKDDNQTK